VKLEDVLLLDPALDEEKALDSRLTVATDKEDRVCAMQKGDIGGFTLDEIMWAVKLTKAKSREIRAMIEEAIK
jgi:exosome complex component RRP42